MFFIVNGLLNDAHSVVLLHFLTIPIFALLFNKFKLLDFHLFQMASTNIDKMPSTSFALPSAPKKNIGSSKQLRPPDSSHHSNGLGSNYGSSSSWIPTLQRNASAK